MRLFVALVPPSEAVEHLDAFLAVRREAAAFRWSLAEQLHVTLAFYGEFDITSLLIGQVLAKVALSIVLVPPLIALGVALARRLDAKPL